MQYHIVSLRQRFKSNDELAAALGVSRDTVNSWCLGRRTPSAAALRLLQVLSLLAADAPALFNALVRPSVTPVIRLPLLDRLPPAVAPIKREAVLTTWSDSWWFVRTVASEGDTPEVAQTVDFLSGLSEEQEAAFLSSCQSYEGRTGRVFPGW